MPDYNKGKIYTIRCRTDETMIYVGSTIQSLAKRWGEHKVDSKKEKQKNRLIYTIINGDWNNWYIELHSLCPCSCKEELCKKEGEITREIGTLNIEIAGRTNKEWRKDNKEKIVEYRKENKEKATEQSKEWRKNNKEKIVEYNKANKKKILFFFL